MSRYKFELATAADDPQLRSILAQTPMAGAVSLVFGREPSYFGAAVVEGRFHQVMIVRNEATGQIVGSGTRFITVRYVNGRPSAIGYLSNLRLLEGHRRQLLLARGYEFLHGLHMDGHTPLYLTTIGQDNTTAQTALAAGRAGLPEYHPAGRYYTAVIPLSRRANPVVSDGVEIRPARQEDAPEILSFLQRIGPRRQFFPCYEAGDLFAADGLLRGLRPGDLLLALRGGRIIGTLGGWDQQAFRQNMVHGYAGPLRRARPLYNIWADLRGLPRLPSPGTQLRCLMGALPLIDGDDPQVFNALLLTMRLVKSGGQWDYLLVGLHEADPLLKALRQIRARWYTTLVYTVGWGDGQAMRQALDGRPLYLELGSL